MIRQYLLIFDEDEGNELYQSLDNDKNVILKRLCDDIFEVFFDETHRLDLLDEVKKLNLDAKVYRLVISNRKKEI